MENKRAAEASTRDSPMKRTKLRTKTRSTSKELVVCNIDLLTQILLRLPASSAIKFKYVCKRWNSLISSRCFCLLWQQHRSPGILLRARHNRFDSHRCIFLFGPDIGAIQFRMSRYHDLEVLQSCNGFLLLKVMGDYRVYNPATLERFRLPLLEMRNQSGRTSYRALGTRVRILEPKEGDDRDFPPEIEHVNLAFDRSSNGRVVALTRDSGDEYIYQIYVAEFGGDRRHSGQVFEYGDELVDGVYWNNSIIWLGKDVTVCFDVDGEELRVGASPPGTVSKSFYFGESGGHLHFIQREYSSTLIVHEMRTDLSAWFVMYSVSSSQIDPSFSCGFGNRFHDKTLKVVSLIESDEDSAVLVLKAQCDIISYRIQDKKSTKLCKSGTYCAPRRIWDGPFLGYRYACQHIESILQFHPSSFSNFIR